MRRLLLALVLLATPLPAQAAGMALRWNTCEGTSNRNFACDRGTGAEVLVGSFSSPTTLGLSGVEAYMRITTADGNIPSWWQMVSRGSCRSTSISMVFDVSTETECGDPWQGQAAGGIGLYKIDGSNGVDVRLAMAVPIAAIQTISGGNTYAAFRMVINHARSNGPAACDGCAKPACITIERMVLTTHEKRDVELTTGIAGMGGAANVVKWQGGTPTCGAGAAKPSTWSELKRRYK